MDSQIFVTRFVKIVEQYPVLYDAKLPLRTPHLCSLTWEKVAEQVRRELKEECTVEELKTRWKGIRSSFSRYSRKLGRSRDKDSTKQYYLYDMLKFLIPHTKATKGYSEADKNDDQSSEGDEWDNDMVHMFSDDIIEHTNTSTNDSLLLPTQSNSLAFPEVKIEPVDDEQTADTTNVTHEDEPLPERDISLKRKIFNTYESKTAKAQKTEENADMQFFRSVLPDIVHFTGFEKRKFKMGVLKLIDDIENSRRDIKLDNNPSDIFN